MKALATALLCAPLVAVWGCKDNGPKPDPVKEQDAALRSQLVGVWERAWDFGPVGYVYELNSDGSLFLHELREANSVAAGAVIEGAMEMYHPVYKVKLRTCRRETGSWTVENGNLVFVIDLASGDPMRQIQRIERASSLEMSLSTSGLDGKTETRFSRRKAGR